MLSFLAVGDWGRRGSPAQRAVAAGMACAATRCHPSLVFSTGDNFYEDGVSCVHDPQFGKTFERVYDAPELDLPWYAVLGNHDYRGSVDAQIAYTRRSRRWHLPSRYYARRFESEGVSALVAFLDTTPFVCRYRPGGSEYTPGVIGQDPEAQLVWLDRILGAQDVDWKLVVGHHPVFSGSPFHGAPPELQARLQPLLERHGVNAYLCGHEHDLQHLEVNGVQYVVTGGGSECRETGACTETRACHGTLGFLTAQAAQHEMTLQLCGADGEPLHEAVIEQARPAWAQAA